MNDIGMISKSLVHGQKVGGNVHCGHFRIRKTWEKTLPADRELYLESIEMAIEQDLFQLFAHIHADRMTELEAHSSCAFSLWHRQFLLVYENMLRSLDSKFACITIPIWDSATHFIQQANGECTNLGGCASIIKDIGGIPKITSPKSGRTVAGIYTLGYCATSRPIKHLCDDHNVCGCLLRGNVQEIPVPSNSGPSTIDTLLSKETYATFTKSLQDTMHNEMHFVFDGSMFGNASPNDPLFFSWHANMDMMLSAWHTCHQDSVMNEEEKQNSHMAFSQDECRYNTRELPKMSSHTRIHMEYNGIDIRSHPILGALFADTAEVYWHLADHRDLGDYSYTYDYPMVYQARLSDNSRCPNSASVYQHVQSLDAYTLWYSRTQSLLKLKHPNDDKEVDLQMKYLECLGFDKQFGVHNFSQKFITDFLHGNEDAKPECKRVVDVLKEEPEAVDKEAEQWTMSSDGSGFFGFKGMTVVLCLAFHM